MKMVWTNEFECGMVLFDDHHRHLFDLINEYSATLDADGNAASENFHALITRTFDAATRHFAEEEKVMRDLGVDMRHVGKHCADHQQYIDQINSIWDGRHTMVSPVAALLDFMDAWIRFHILDGDQVLVRQIKRLQAGENASAAYETEESAVDRINPTLVAAKRLHQLTAGHLEHLIKSNQLLEARVMERTRELEAVNKRLEMMSCMDGLLGISNRTYFDERIKPEWRLARRHKQPISLVLIDVDFLRKFNETYGHLEGDNCLRSVARAAREALFRPTDILARYGGEEIVALLPNTTLDGARLVAERVKAIVDSYAIPHAASEVGSRLSISLGVATAEPDKGGEALTMFLQAESALMQAKKRGRNQVQVYRETSALVLAKG